MLFYKNAFITRNEVKNTVRFGAPHFCAWMQQQSDWVVYWACTYHKDYIYPISGAKPISRINPEFLFSWVQDGPWRDPDCSPQNIQKQINKAFYSIQTSDTHLFKREHIIILNRWTFKNNLLFKKMLSSLGMKWKNVSNLEHFIFACGSKNNKKETSSKHTQQAMISFYHV